MLLYLFVYTDHVVKENVNKYLRQRVASHYDSVRPLLCGQLIRSCWTKDGHEMLYANCVCWVLNIYSKLCSESEAFASDSKQNLWINISQDNHCKRFYILLFIVPLTLWCRVIVMTVSCTHVFMTQKHKLVKKKYFFKRMLQNRFFAYFPLYYMNNAVFSEFKFSTTQ